MNLTNLKKSFENYPLDSFNDYEEYISSKNDKGVFPPYIPFVGKHYEKYRILFYATAQNLKLEDPLLVTYANNREKLIERLWYSNKFKNKYPIDKFSYTDIDIQPVHDGVIPAYLGIFILTKLGININKIRNFNNLIDKVAVSNYYKFSLRTKFNNDNNPDNIRGLFRDSYYKLNNELVKMEVEALEPEHVIMFDIPGKRFLKNLLSGKPVIYTVYDPACLKHGGSQHVTKYKHVQIQESNVRKLLHNYTKNITGYNKEHIMQLLIKYYIEWSKGI